MTIKYCLDRTLGRLSENYGEWFSLRLHFVWAALLSKNFDSEFVSKVLNAHENNVLEKAEGRSMDLANNRLGQIVAQRLRDKKQLSEEQIIQSFQQERDKGNLVILKKTFKNRKAKK